MSCDEVPPIDSIIVPGTERHVALLSVLTYNVEGLGWPARSGRADELRRIGEHLAALRATGTAPDIVLVQEMFSGPAKRALLASGYPAIRSGPKRTARAPRSDAAPLPGKASIARGEVGLHLTGSGLAIASRFPVQMTRSRPYDRRSCAGIDCLANKGIMLARVTIPGVPTPIDIFNTHMNSRSASRAPVERNRAAHARQAREASQFIEESRDPDNPVIFGGDFNMRHALLRWENFSRRQSLRLVHHACLEPASPCEIRMSWDGDAPWVDTQDLQFFDSGSQVRIEPVRVESLFDGGPNGPVLSDHDGFKVTYRLSWPAGATSSASVSASCENR